MTRWLIRCILSLVLYTHATLAAGELPESIRQKLLEIRYSGREILFVDVDNTIALQHNKDDIWVVYDGAVEFLRKQSKKFAIVLFTSNLRPKIEVLKAAHPEIAELVELEITANEYAPWFAQLMEDVAPALKLNPDPPRDEWRKLVYDTVKKNPARYLPPGVSIGLFPNNIPDFRRDVYIKYILPNKAPVVKKFHGILFDDHLRVNDVEQAFKDLEAEGQAVFEGRIGGDLAYEGPDYDAVSKRLIGIECSRKFERE